MTSAPIPARLDVTPLGHAIARDDERGARHKNGDDTFQRALSASDNANQERAHESSTTERIAHAPNDRTKTNAARNERDARDVDIDHDQERDDDGARAEMDAPAASTNQRRDTLPRSVDVDPLFASATLQRSMLGGRATRDVGAFDAADDVRGAARLARRTSSTSTVPSFSRRDGATGALEALGLRGASFSGPSIARDLIRTHGMTIDDARALLDATTSPDATTSTMSALDDALKDATVDAPARGARDDARQARTPLSSTMNAPLVDALTSPHAQRASALAASRAQTPTRAPGRESGAPSRSVRPASVSDALLDLALDRAHTATAAVDSVVGNVRAHHQAPASMTDAVLGDLTAARSVDERAAVDAPRSDVGLSDAKFNDAKFNDANQSSTTARADAAGTNADGARNAVASTTSNATATTAMTSTMHVAGPHGAPLTGAAAAAATLPSVRDLAAPALPLLDAVAFKDGVLEAMRVSPRAVELSVHLDDGEPVGIRIEVRDGIAHVIASGANAHLLQTRLREMETTFLQEGLRLGEFSLATDGESRDDHTDAIREHTSRTRASSSTPGSSSSVATTAHAVPKHDGRVSIKA